MVRDKGKARRRSLLLLLLAAGSLTLARTPAQKAFAQEQGEGRPAPEEKGPPPARRLAGAAAFGDWKADAPGVRRLIVPADLPPPYATRSASNAPRVIRRPAGAAPRTPAGFAVNLFAEGLDNPRLLRVAPNGDVFVAETFAGRIRVLRPAQGGETAQETSVFVSGLDQPFGIAFYPPGADPQWVYVANTGAVARFPYRNGDLRARGPAETIVGDLPEGGHTTRDVVFSPDGARMFVSVGSLSNVAIDLKARSAEDRSRREAKAGASGAPPGAPWGSEERRAAVLAFTPQGREGRLYATGLRNCVGMAVQPATGALWCATNERDGLGDNLVPDHVTRVRDGAFYGWPWFYIGDNEDPRHKGARPDLKGRTTVPDVLLQPHSAPLQMTFYDGALFPAAYQGDAFVALHGSWNRSARTGYKVVRALVRDGVPTGEYEDFVTGFVAGDASVWGRPVGVAVARDGALLLSEDGNGAVWRISHGATGK